MSGHGETIRITGARQNNLKDVSLDIPKNRIVVFTGVSGSGKSSIVFDTVAVESQRQLNETFAWYIRNRLPRHERPDADLIDDLAPAVVVDQRPVGGNARSTVGTMTDIYSVLRVLFSRYGEPSAGEARLLLQRPRRHVPRMRRPGPRRPRRPGPVPGRRQVAGRRGDPVRAVRHRKLRVADLCQIGVVRPR
ncbi:hypothetical protein ACFQX6_19600 [Streptosporangium lutulentum]